MPKGNIVIYIFDLLMRGVEISDIAGLIEKHLWEIDEFGRLVTASNYQKNLALMELRKFKVLSDSADSIHEHEDYTAVKNLIYMWSEGLDEVLEHRFAKFGWPTNYSYLQTIISNKKTTFSEPLNCSEKASFQKMLLGMAIAKYGYVPGKKNSCTGANNTSIHYDLSNLGIHIDEDTIRKHLKDAAQEIEFEIPDKKN